MNEGAPTCTCMSGFEQTEQGCSPVQQGKPFSGYLLGMVPYDDVTADKRGNCIFTVTCNEEDNCSPFAFCTSGGDRKHHVCICMPGYVGE